MTTDTFVKFHQMSEDPAVELHALTGLDRLKDAAPSDAAIAVTVAMDGEAFVAQLQLRSGDLSFNIAQRARSAFMAVEKTFNEARIEIQNWKVRREFFPADANGQGGLS